MKKSFLLLYYINRVFKVNYKIIKVDTDLYGLFTEYNVCDSVVIKYDLNTVSHLTVFNF